MKGAYGLVTGLIVAMMTARGTKKLGYGTAIAATAAGALTYAALNLSKSYFYSGLFLNGLTADAALLTVIGKLPATTFNALVAVIFAPILAIAIQKALEKNHLSID